MNDRQKKILELLETAKNRLNATVFDSSVGHVYNKLLELESLLKEEFKEKGNKTSVKGTLEQNDTPSED